ncbi:MAG: hydantoinase B/oxoprolinase family protein [Gammaproteobacteria bacterium]|nr:hydantoinase B/oxoprolinase family protein [Gammaproteobacteria bacterium]
MTVSDIDPITLQVIGGALDTIAKEMGHVLYRMSYSSIIRESQDLGAGLFDADFNTLCESDSTPMHIGSLPGYLRGIKDTLHGDWRPGDIVIHNHPYHGASHSPDIAIVAPVFFDGELVAFSANTAHHVDIGAATPGLIIDVPDVYGEGMLFKGLKLYDEGKLNRALWQFIETNTRAPGQVMGDLEAQIASAELGVRRFNEMLETYGKDTVTTACNQLMDYSETMLRRQIAAIPDGEYTAEGFLDDDGRNRGVTLPLKVTVRVKGDGVEVDLTGSADQTPTAFNVPFEGSTKVACYYAFRALLLDTYTTPEYIPQNEGSFRPITVTAPKGSIFNPIFPAAAEARFAPIQRVVDCIIKALAPVLPNNVTAGNSASLSFGAYSGLRENGDIWVFLEVNEGSYGGRPASDGPDSIDNLLANTRNNPIEDLGMHLPLICDRYELRDDVLPAPGKFRGGIGVVKTQRFIHGGVMTHEADRHEDRPWGIHAGHAGHGGRVVRYNVDSPDEREALPAKFSGLITVSGDCIEIHTPCGGGFGDPLDRDSESVRADVLDDFSTVEQAFEAYGVVLDDALNVDRAATAARRAELKQGVA